MSSCWAMCIRALAALALATVLPACGDSVTGTWVLDKDRTLASAEEAMEREMGPQGGEELVEMTRKMMRESFKDANMTLELRGDQSFAVSGTGPGSLTMEGTWEKTDDGYRLSPNDAGPVLTLRKESGRLTMRGPMPNAPTMYLKRE